MRRKHGIVESMAETLLEKDTDAVRSFQDNSGAPAVLEQDVREHPFRTADPITAEKWNRRGKHVS